jgi:hypothetical protein
MHPLLLAAPRRSSQMVRGHRHRAVDSARYVAMVRHRRGGAPRSAQRRLRGSPRDRAGRRGGDDPRHPHPAVADALPAARRPRAPHRPPALRRVPDAARDRHPPSPSSVAGRAGPPRSSAGSGSGSSSTSSASSSPPTTTTSSSRRGGEEAGPLADSIRRVVSDLEALPPAAPSLLARWAAAVRRRYFAVVERSWFPLLLDCVFGLWAILSVLTIIELVFSVAPSTRAVRWRTSSATTSLICRSSIGPISSRARAR